MFRDLPFHLIIANEREGIPDVSTANATRKCVADCTETPAISPVNDQALVSDLNSRHIQPLMG